jgi:UDP-N-acetylmuramate dehydrogenase
VEIRSERALKTVLKTLQETTLPRYVLGGGSDTLFTDEGFQGVVLHPSGARDLNIQHNEMVVGAGWTLSRVIQHAARAGLSGMEELYGIPGTLGGAVAKNAGAFGREIAELVSWIEVYRWDGSFHRISGDEAGFVYRDSLVRREGVIWRVALHLRPGNPDAIRQQMDNIYARRTRSQPYGFRSSGCIFRNPPGDSAGRILDQMGLKGYRVGGVWVSRRHANFLVHRGEARARDVLELIREIQQRVQRERGISLHPEVVLVGPRGEEPW